MLLKLVALPIPVTEDVLSESGLHPTSLLEANSSMSCICLGNFWLNLDDGGLNLPPPRLLHKVFPNENMQVELVLMSSRRP